MFFKIKIKYNDIIIMTIPYAKQQPPPINQLPNVNISESLADGEVLTYNEATEEWINGTAGGGGGTEIVATNNLRSLTTGTGTNLTSSATNNILIGENVGEGLTTQDNNIQLGHNINSTNEGVRNILIGRDLGLSTTGGYNIVLGSDIGNSASPNGIFSNRNIMIGHNVGGTKIVGQWNVLIGEDTNRGSNGVSLNNNVMIGRQAGDNCRTSQNTFVGYGAGQNNINGQNNTSIGNKAGGGNNSNETINIGSEAGRVRPTGQDHAICIGTQTGNFNSGEHSIQIGYRANYNTPASYKRVIVLNASGSALESTQSDTFKVKPIRNATGVANALFYDATSGEITYDTAGGGGTEIVATRNLITSALGAGSSLDPTGTDNILLGNNAGSSLVSHDGNIMLGYNAGRNTINNNNVAIGYESAGGNTNLQNSITIGHYAGEGSTNLTDSVVIGNGAGYQMTNAIGSTFIGYSAGRFKRGNFNVAVGYEALRNNTTTTDAIGIGYFAGRNNNGTGAICIGTKAGETNAGNFSVLIGYGAGQVGGSFANTLVLNAGSVSLNPTQANSCFIKPIRGVAHGIGVGLTKYDPTTGELTYSTT
jgi:trimeric autotransporter adhesin